MEEGLTLEQLYELRDRVERAIAAYKVGTDIVSQTACGNAECTCRFYYPYGLSHSQLACSPVVSIRKLVVSFLCENGETYQEERQRLIDVLLPIRAQYITVTADRHVGFLTFLVHSEAVRAQQKLESAGFTVNFYCENVKELKVV